MENGENELVQELLKRIERLEVQVKELQDQLKRIKSLP
jgi:chaperonin cofactor prefoldin